MKDKILFWIDQTLIDYGTANALHSKHDCDIYGIIDVTDRTKTFFQTQKSVNFQKIWFYHDNIKKTDQKPDVAYLSSFETKYRINLMTLVYNERIFYQYNDYYQFNEIEVLSIVEQECKFFENVLDEIDPDFIIMNQAAFHHSFLFYKICKSRGIRILILKPIRLGYKCMITGEDEVIDYAGKSMPKTSRTLEELRKYLEEFSIYKQVEEFEDQFQKSKSGFINAVIQFLFVSSNSNVKTHYTYYGRSKLRVLFNSLMGSLRSKYRKKFIDNNLLYDIDDDAPFIYFPLHIEQERSLLILAPFYTNQLEAIKNIVKSLPIDHRLLVKEHPAMFSRGWRPALFYKEIMNLPNVRLLHPSVNPTELIEKCSLVIGISGTNSFDAAFHGKPSIVFTDTAFSSLPSVNRLKSLEELPSTIQESLKTVVNPDDLNEYVTYLDDISFDFNLDGFVQVHHDHFYYGGFLVDVEISEKKMNSFFKHYKPQFDILASEFLKAINKTR